MIAKETIDWSECPLVEINPHVQGGTPVLRGTQVLVNVIVDKFESGVSIAELSQQFKIPRDCIRAVVFYAKGQRVRQLRERS